MPSTQLVEEVAPYVRSAYDGGRGTLYREEPVVLAFTEDFHVAVPIAQRPGGTSAEHNTLLRMQLIVRPVIAPKAGTPFTATGKDWIVEHRGAFVNDPVGPFRDLLSVSITAGTAMRSINPFRRRLAVLTGRPGASCPLQDPLDVVGTTLIAFPQGETGSAGSIQRTVACRPRLHGDGEAGRDPASSIARPSSPRI